MYSRDNVHFVLDALESGWTVRKKGKFYELINSTHDESLTVPSFLHNATSLTALFEDIPDIPIRDVPSQPFMKIEESVTTCRD